MRSLLILFCCIAIQSTAQRVVDVTNQDINISGSNLFYAVGGNPVSTAKYVKVEEGTPFFKEDYMTADIKLPKGLVCKNAKVKLDLLANEVYYLSEDGRQLQATIPIEEIVFKDSSIFQTYRFIHSSNFEMKIDKEYRGWYQVLHTGKQTFLKRYKKTVDEIKPWASATTVQHILTTPQFFVVKNNNLLKLPRWKDITAAFPEKKKELQELINNKGLTGKLDADYIAVAQLANEGL